MHEKFDLSTFTGLHTNVKRGDGGFRLNAGFVKNGRVFSKTDIKNEKFALLAFRIHILYWETSAN